MTEEDFRALQRVSGTVAEFSASFWCLDLDTIQLQALGFDEQKAVGAYLICDKNEQHAINYLIENPDGLDGSGFVSLSPPMPYLGLNIKWFQGVSTESAWSSSKSWYQ